MSQPVCGTCKDTHVMMLFEREVPCTFCPVPCGACREGGRGAYCATLPCQCACHAKKDATPTAKVVPQPPTKEDRERAEAVGQAWWTQDSQQENLPLLMLLTTRVALEFARVRAETLERAAALLEKPRCRMWSPLECSMAVRGLDHPPECSCHRWQDCRVKT